MRWTLIIFFLGGLTSLAQFIFAWLGLWIIASFGAGMLCLLVGFGLSRFARYQSPSRPDFFPQKPEEERVRLKRPPAGDRRMGFHLAFSPYYGLIVIVMATTFIPFVHDVLHGWSVKVPLEALRTGLGFSTPEKLWRLEPLGHPGALLLCTSWLGYLIYRANGRWPGREARLFRNTFRETLPTSVGTVSMVAMATVMTVSGMIQVLAEGGGGFFGSTVPRPRPVGGADWLLCHREQHEREYPFREIPGQCRGVARKKPVGACRRKQRGRFAGDHDCSGQGLGGLFDRRPLGQRGGGFQAGGALLPGLGGARRATDLVARLLIPANLRGGCARSSGRV